MLGVENCKYRLGEDVYFLWQNKIFLGKIEGRHASESLRRYDVRCDVNPNNRLSFSFCEELLFTKIDDLTDYLEDEYYSRKQKEYDEKEEKSKDKWGTWFEPVESNKIPPTMINLENLAERIKGLERWRNEITEYISNMSRADFGDYLFLLNKINQLTPKSKLRTL